VNQSEFQKEVEQIRGNLAVEVEQHSSVKGQCEEAMAQVSRLERASTMDVGQFEALESSNIALESQVSQFKAGLIFQYLITRLELESRDDMIASLNQQLTDEKSSLQEVQSQIVDIRSDKDSMDKKVVQMQLVHGETEKELNTVKGVLLVCFSSPYP
jgi:predicted RNase H-like nuclease (RuvC/YqgF family)